MKGLIFVYTLTALGVVGGLRSPRIGLFVYVALAILRPAHLWAWAGNMDGLSRLVGVAMLIGWAISGFGRWKFERGRGIVVAVGVYFLWMTLSAIQAENTSVAFASVVEISKVLLPFFVGVTVLESQADIRRMLWVIVASQAYVCFELHLSYFNGYNRAQLEGFGGMDNNCLGIALVTTMGAAVAVFFSSTRWIERGAASVAGVLVLHTVLLTFSRGALLGLIMLGLAAFIMMPKRPRYLLAGAVVALLTIRLTGPELAARYETAFAEQNELDDSATSRLDLWANCLEIMAREPFFGVGPRNFPLVASRFGWPVGKEAHSVWFQSGAELGVPGVVALLTVYLLAGLRLWGVVRNRPAVALTPRTAIAFGLAIAFAGYVTSAQFVSLIGLETPFHLAMLAVVLLRQREEPAPPVARQPITVVPTRIQSTRLASPARS